MVRGKIQKDYKTIVCNTAVTNSEQTVAILTALLVVFSFSFCNDGLYLLLLYTL